MRCVTPIHIDMYRNCMVWCNNYPRLEYSYDDRKPIPTGSGLFLCVSQNTTETMVSFRFPTIPTSWASYQIRKIAGCACARNAGNVFPRRRFQMKQLVSDPGMHHGTCVTHVPWCMSGSLTCGDGKTFPAFLAHAHPQFCVSGKRPMSLYAAA